MLAVALPLALAWFADAPSAQAPLDFRTPDGTRVLLLARLGAPIVHWAVATPCGSRIDSAATPLLAEAVVRASMRGTWTCGSLDVAKERAAFDELDSIEAELAAPVSKNPDELKLKIARAEVLRQNLTALSDPAAFRRLLAASPANNVDLRVDRDVAVLSLTTTPLGVPRVAKMLLDRREQQSLRGYADELASLQREQAAAWDQDQLAPLYAEALALAFPGHALARSGDRPKLEPVRRSAAIAAWARSQHPQSTVIALVGNFDTTSVRQQLERTFTTTSLGTFAPEPRAEARPANALRRAVVPGARRPAALFAFALPQSADVHGTMAIARWFADGSESWLGRELVRAGRASATVAVRSGWPEAASPGLLIIEATDAAGSPPNLADDVLKALVAAQRAAPEPGRLPIRFAAIQRAFLERTSNPYDLAAAVAGHAVANPTSAPLSAPMPPQFGELADALHRILSANPIVVEWRDS